MSKLDVMIVPDASKDVRFKDGPLVVGDPKIRFYAGSALMSPEGYKLGTLCVISPIARPQGLSDAEQGRLKELAAMAVESLVEHKRRKATWFTNLVKTQFPALKNMDPDNNSTTTTKAEEEKDLMEIDDKKKDGDDVTDAATKSMSLMTLVQVLQEKAKEQNLTPDYLNQCAKLATKLQKQQQEKETETKMTAAETETTSADDVAATVEKVSLHTPQKRHQKGGSIRIQEESNQVYEIESLKAYPRDDLWWSEGEMHEIRSNAVAVVHFYQRHRPQFIDSVEIIAHGHDQPADVLEYHMRLLLEDPHGRGLEGHIVELIGEHRQSAIYAVLDELDECELSGDEMNFDKLCDCLREESLRYSEVSFQLAHGMGQIDEVAALQAIMSPWEDEEEGVPK